MILLPAVDILDGKTVRLAKGSFDSRTVYDADPLDAARRWVKGGARMLHVVDLDGARTGTPRHLELVSKIANTVDVPIELGGGLRTVDAVDEALEAGAARIVLGTAAYRDVDFLDEALREHGDRVVVSIDARNGRLAAEGWLEQTDIPDESVVAHFGARGVRRFIYSSIEHDGTLSGPDLGGARRIASAVRGSFIYSGRALRNTLFHKHYRIEETNEQFDNSPRPV